MFTGWQPIVLLILVLVFWVWQQPKNKSRAEISTFDQSIRDIQADQPLQEPSPIWKKVDARNTLELYDVDRHHLAEAIIGLARVRGNVDIDVPLDRFGSGLRGFAYSIQDVSKWAQKYNSSYKSLGAQRMLTALQGFKILDQNWKVQPKFDTWVVCAYSSPSAFTHERVHCKWIQDLNFRHQVLEWWTRNTRGLTQEQKLEPVVANKLRGGMGRWTMLLRRGEDVFVEEFMATHLENIIEQARVSGSLAQHLRL